ncbi:MAG: DUF4258 domain-containing protein [Dehalococcoidia bacterium]|nr:DUF4258 domain-containing protein [Dehalococcoidia bacterium]
MHEYEFSEHAHDMLTEREILADWLERTLEDPATIEAHEDGTTHFLRAIPEHEGRVLRVVTNQAEHPKRIVTLFFDCRLGRQT